MTTLEQALRDDLDEYFTLRPAKITEIEAYIRDHLANPELAESIAVMLIERAEELGRIDGNTVEGEVPAKYTATGNPLPFTI